MWFKRALKCNVLVGFCLYLVYTEKDKYCYTVQKIVGLGPISYCGLTIGDL